MAEVSVFVYRQSLNKLIKTLSLNAPFCVYSLEKYILLLSRNDLIRSISASCVLQSNFTLHQLMKANATGK